MCVLEETVPCSEEDTFTNIPLSPTSPEEVHITVEECIPPPPPQQPPPEDDDEDESEGKVQDGGEGVKEDGEKEEREEGSKEEGRDKEGKEKEEEKEESARQENVGKGEVVINFDGIGINVDEEDEMNV